MVSKIDMLINSKSMKMDNECMVTLIYPIYHLIEICDKHTNMTLKQILENSEFASKVMVNFKTGRRLQMKSSQIQTLFDKSISKVINAIEHVLPKSEKEVTTLILAGNMARCGLLIQAIQTAFPSKKIVVSDEATGAALSGAVWFGLQPIEVSSILSGAQVIVNR